MENFGIGIYKLACVNIIKTASRHVAKLFCKVNIRCGSILILV